MFAISGTKLDIGYEERLILKDFDMTVRKGEITTFVGPNGSGKSTLLKTLTRLISPQKGRITCCGKNLDEIPNQRICPDGGRPAPAPYRTARLCRKGSREFWPRALSGVAPNDYGRRREGHLPRYGSNGRLGPSG